jgi:hypothetical protein
MINPTSSPKRVVDDAPNQAAWIPIEQVEIEVENRCARITGVVGQVTKP